MYSIVPHDNTVTLYLVSLKLAIYGIENFVVNQSSQFDVMI